MNIIKENNEPVGDPIIKYEKTPTGPVLLISYGEDKMPVGGALVAKERYNIDSKGLPYADPNGVWTPYVESAAAPTTGARVTQTIDTPEFRERFKYMLRNEYADLVAYIDNHYCGSESAAAPAEPAGWREFIENIATPYSEPLNSVSGYRDMASRKEMMGVLRSKAQALLATHPIPTGEK